MCPEVTNVIIFISPKIVLDSDKNCKYVEFVTDEQIISDKF